MRKIKYKLSINDNVALSYGEYILGMSSRIFYKSLHLSFFRAYGELRSIK